MKMKCFLIYLFSFFIFSNCFSQKLVKSLNDAYKIIQNENQFIGKPLRFFLNEIAPEIKMAYGDPSKNVNSKVGYFRFSFVDRKSNDSLRAAGKKPLSIVVYVKEYFDWDFKKRVKGEEMVWSEGDIRKYGDLTVVGFRVYGD